MPIISGGSGSSGSSVTTYRKVTPKVVSGTVTETDLLNGEITLTTRLTATAVVTIDLFGDYVQNIANATALPTLKLKLGSTVLFQWQPFSAILSSQSSATRYGWSFRAVIANANATNSQKATLSGTWTGLSNSATTAAAAALTTGEGTHGMSNQTGVASIETMSAYNTAAVDTTAAPALTFTTTNGTASTPYDITLAGCLVTIL